MNLRDLEYLVAVADHMHFGKAAKAVHVSQPTLSMQLKKLEEYLGVKCFERAGKRVLLTPSGQELCHKARNIVTQARELKELAKSRQNPLGGDFYLGAFPTLAPFILPLIVPHIRKALPSLKLFLVEEKTSEIMAKLVAGKIDAALVALPVEERGVEYLPLFTDPFMLAVPEGHRLAKRRQASMSDINHEELLLLEEGHCLRAQALEVCSIAGAAESQQFRATSMETLRQMVASGVGITLIPKMASRKDDGVVYIPFKEKKLARSIGLVWRSGSGRAQAISRLGQIIQSMAG